ncbi:MAG: ABC transporter ATP-binding protein [Clostridiales bacterium]|jgi:ABC-2 type transport system ATP-binding protein|nr:ABC transporter ATP-binding protein [Clostridiales bacterium]
MLKIENLRKAFGEKAAVDGVSLSIAPGEICGFIGRNGAGKTTTIKCVCGIISADGGEIFVDGRNTRTDPLGVKRVVAYIPDNPDIYEFLTGIQYLNFVADIFGVSGETRRERIERYAGAFELTRDLAQSVSGYSHGMKQKLALISALIHNPKLMLLDEPFVGLDPNAARELRRIMRERCDAGGAIFFSTHALEVAERLCDKIAIIKEGKLLAFGPTEAVKGNSSLESAFFELTDVTDAGGEK